MNWLKDQALNWVTNSFVHTFADFMIGTITLFGAHINNIFQVVAKINNTKLVNAATKYTCGLGIAVLIFICIKQILEVHIMEFDGETDESVFDIIARATKATALICCQGFVFDQLLQLSAFVVEDIIGTMYGTNFSKHTEDMIRGILENITAAGAVWMILISITMCSVVFFCFQAGIRGAELMAAKILFPLMVIDMVTRGKERWNQFFSSYIVLFFGYAIQLVLFQLFLNTFLKVAVDAEKIPHFIAALGCLFVAIKTPRWLEKFAYSSGIGNITKGALRTSVMAAVFIR